MSIRFLSLIALFTGALLFFLVGSFNLEWQPQANGSSKMLLSVEIKLPKPVIQDVNNPSFDSSSNWGQLLSDSLRRALIRALGDPDQKDKKHLNQTSNHRKNVTHTGFQRNASPELKTDLKTKWMNLKGYLKRSHQIKNVETVSGGAIG